MNTEPGMVPWSCSSCSRTSRNVACAQARLGLLGLDLGDALTWRPGAGRGSSAIVRSLLVEPVNATAMVGYSQPSRSGLRPARPGREHLAEAVAEARSRRRGSNGVGSPLRTARTAPARSACSGSAGRRVHARATCRRRGTRRHPRRRAVLAARSAGTRFSPNEIVADFSIPPHSRQAGSSSPARTRASVSSIGPRQPHCRHFASCTVPWISMTISGDVPAAWCRPSTFCVTSVCTFALRSSSASARWPALGSPANSSLPARLRHTLRVGAPRPAT